MKRTSTFQCVTFINIFYISTIIIKILNRFVKNTLSLSLDNTIKIVDQWPGNCSFKHDIKRTLEKFRFWFHLVEAHL
jgi:hypothetical protein